jgi:hypothetical protein
VVEYGTPPHADGLGTEFILVKGDLPILGVAMLVGRDPPDLMLLSVRLPPSFAELASAIIHYVELDTEPGKQ